MCTYSQALTVKLCTTAGDGPTLKAVLHLVDEGIEHALEERSKPWGVAREGALLAALRVLVTALQTDSWLLQELRQHPKSGKHHFLYFSPW